MSRPPIAIIGMAARIPQAPDLATMWRNVLAGESCIATLEARDGEVPARGVLGDVDRFDAALFGYRREEAAAMDPQHRVFLELCWHALEDAGLDPFRTDETVSAYVACGPEVAMPTAPHASLADTYQAHIAAASDLLAGRVAHTLDLKGESLVVQTGCSSSLVAVHLACQSLLTGSSAVALAGGVAISADERRGYVMQQDMVLSPSGRCRPFDEDADGTVPGSGGGVVVLKPLSAALADGDAIYAVVRGSAVNNDGRVKASFMAPSVAGQTAVIRSALSSADVAPSSIGLIEAHGTATRLGDAIELEALATALRSDGAEGTVHLGSLKGSAGHLDRAAGVVGLIKAALALYHRTIPPAAGSSTPRQELFERAPDFVLPPAPREWPADGTRRRAGINSFGIGGTNAHVVLEEAPEETVEAAPGDGLAIVALSAASPFSLEGMKDGLAAALRATPHLDVAAIADTHNLRRPMLRYRCGIVARDAPTLAAALETTEITAAKQRPIVFMFPGHGRDVSIAFGRRGSFAASFHQTLDECRTIVRERAGLDLCPLLSRGIGMIERMEHAQPALFAVEYALARQWMDWGVTPDAVLGHSMGEIVGATIAGVFSLEGGIELVTERGRLVDEAGHGRMLAVTLTEDELRAILPSELDVAAVNGESLAVVAGREEPVAAFAATLEARGVWCGYLDIARAGHSAVMDNVLLKLRSAVDRVGLATPEIPLISGETGAFSEPADLISPDYWVRHLRCTVRFGEALDAAVGLGGLLIEMGPGGVLTRLAESAVGGSDAAAFSAWDDEAGTTEEAVARGVARAWSAGVAVDWERVNARSPRFLRLPGYPLDHRESWPTPEPASTSSAPARRDVAGDSSSALGQDGAHSVGQGRSAEEVKAEIEALWQELLGTPIDRETDFFSAGGDSLLALRMLARLRGIGYEVSLRAFFAEPSIDGLARLVVDAQPI
jgi:phthiocerol/phenolphthiocerol synthesis type-I polyketide synthase E